MHNFFLFFNLLTNGVIVQVGMIDAAVAVVTKTDVVTTVARMEDRVVAAAADTATVTETTVAEAAV